VLQFLKTKSRGREDICGIINSDIHLRNIDNDMKQFIYENAKKGLVYGHRYDIDNLDDINGTEYIGLDFFFFNKDLIELYQDDGLVIGGSAWDYWMIFIIRHFGKCAYQLRTPIAYHIRHPQTWDEEQDFINKRGLAVKYLGEASARAVRKINDTVFSNPDVIRFTGDSFAKSVLIILPENVKNMETVKSLQNQVHKNKRIVYADASLYDFESINEDYVLIAADGCIYDDKFLLHMLSTIKQSSLTCQIELRTKKMDAHTLFVFDADSILNLEDKIVNGCTLLCRDKIISGDSYQNGRFFTDDSLVSMEYDDYAESIISRLRGKKIYLWGAGRTAHYLLKYIDVSPVHILGIVDSNIRLHGQNISGIPIISKDVLENTNEYDAVLITALQYELMIYDELITMIPKEKIIRQFYGGFRYRNLSEKLRYQDLILIGEEDYINDIKQNMKDIFILKSIPEKNLSADDLLKMKEIPNKNILAVCATKNPDSLIEKLSDIGLVHDEHFITGESLVSHFRTL
jgi:flagellar motor switch/type III secretory pathway protein FliN